LTSGQEAAGTPQAPAALSEGAEKATPADMGRSPGDEEVEEDLPGAEDVVTSTGERIVSEEGEAGGMGKAAGGDVGREAQVEEARQVDWLVYRNEEFGFQIRYPSVYILAPAPAPEEGQEPQPLAEFLFQDRELAASETAAMEPPQFAIRVFANEEGLPVERWLQQSEALGEEGFQVEPFSLGGVEGVQVTSQFLIAPGQHVYVAKGKYVFQLTPLGPYSNQMLASFAFLD
ncbi:MAG: hypothetical protein H5T59_09215, partial [Anaerolineae bacterium]|nr:hypothetical protein [Anaerolineae bacterium]